MALAFLSTLISTITSRINIDLATRSSPLVVALEAASATRHWSIATCRPPEAADNDS